MTETERTLKAIHGKPGDPSFEALFAMMEAMREAVIPVIETFADPRDGLSVLMSAAATFSGIQAGTLMAGGAFRTQDRKRVGDAALANFRQGLDIGLNRGLRIGADHFGGNA